MQPLSLYYAFLDVSGSIRLHGLPETIGKSIKQTIRSELGLTASVGIAPLKFVAKIASDLNKPDGFVQVSEEGLRDFLDPLPVSRLWGVGRVGRDKLQRLNLTRIGDIRVFDADVLKQKFGRWGEHLWRLANGIDPRKVVPDHRAKQISHERTFNEDISDENMLNAAVSHLSQQVARRLRRNGRQTRSVSLKYRREDFQTFSHTQKLAQPTDSTDKIASIATELLNTMRGRQPRPVRLIGVSLGSLTENDAPQQLSLFESKSHEQRDIDQIVDAISDQMGGDPIYRATSHQWVAREKRD